MDAPTYVPTIKGMTNDLKAVAHTSDGVNKSIKPLVELTNVDQYPTPEDALEKFVGRIVKQTGIGRMFIDLYGLPPNARTATGEVATVAGFRKIARAGVVATPVYGLGINDVVWRPLSEVVAKLGQGFCFRIDIDDLDDRAEDTWQEILERSAELELHASSVDVLVDTRSLLDRDVGKVQDLILDFLLLRPRGFRFRHLIVTGSSALRDVSTVPQHGVLSVERAELRLWAQLTAELDGAFSPIYGDYGVIHPDFNQSGPNKNVNGKIRYTARNFLHYFRGSKLLAPPGYEQYRGLSSRVMASPVFSGADFSVGDRRIVQCADRTVGTGNLGTWVFADQNHHFEYVVHQIDSLSKVLRSARTPKEVDEAVETV